MCLQDTMSLENNIFFVIVLFANSQGCRLGVQPGKIHKAFDM